MKRLVPLVCKAMATAAATTPRMRLACQTATTLTQARGRAFCTQPPQANPSEQPKADAPTPAPPVLVEKLEQIHVMTIAINRPDKRNCVDRETSEKLHEAFDDFEHDENMYCAVLHGVGGNFCAGFDLEELSKMEADLANHIAAMMDRGPMGPSRMELSKPVIGAISGWAVAGGMELAMMCDLRIMEETAKTGVLCRRFGVPLIDGGTVRLPQLVGFSRAMDLILTGRIVEAKEAYDIGWANRLVHTGTAFGQAMNIAREMTKFPQACLRADRASAYHASFASKSLADSLQFESESSLQVINKESIDGAKRFVAGLGRAGKFNVTPAVEPQPWQQELEAMKKEVAGNTPQK